MDAEDKEDVKGKKDNSAKKRKQDKKIKAIILEKNMEDKDMPAETKTPGPMSSDEYTKQVVEEANSVIPMPKEVEVKAVMSKSRPEPAQVPSMVKTVVTINIPEIKLFKLDMRNKFYSLFQIYQSELGYQIGLMIKDESLTISDFTEITQFWLNLMELHYKIWEAYKGVKADVPKESVNNYFRDAFPTKPEHQGIDLYNLVIHQTDSWFVISDNSTQIRRGIQSFSNIDVRTTPPKIRCNAVNVMLDEERSLSDFLHDLELTTHTFSMDTIDDFVADYNDWYVFARYPSEVYKGEFRNGYSFFTHVPINYNYQILCDQYAPMRLYSHRLLASSLRNQIVLKSQADAGTYSTKIQVVLNIQMNKINEDLFLPKILAAVKVTEFFSDAMATILCSRWVRVDNYRDRSYKPNVVKILDAILDKAFWPRRAMSDSYVKHMEIYLILNFIKVLVTSPNDAASTDYSYYDNIPDPINHYVSSHQFATNIAKYPSTVTANTLPAVNGITQFLVTTGPGTGWAGNGRNQNYHSAPRQVNTLFTINDYEPIFGNPYIKTGDPPQYDRIDSLMQFISSVNMFTPTISDAATRQRYTAVQRLLSMVSEQKVNLRYMCLLMERVNKFWTPVIYAGPSSDDITLDKSLHRANMPPNDSVSVDSFNEIQEMVSSAAVTPAQLMDFSPGSIFVTMTYYSFMDEATYRTAPPVDIWHSGWTINNELRELAANIFRSLMFMPKSFFTWSKRLEKALSCTEDTKFMVQVKNTLTNLRVGYPGMDGLDYHVAAFMQVRNFMNLPRIRPFMGYADSFTMGNRVAEHITYQYTGLNNFLYNTVIKDVITHDFILTQTELQESATSNLILDTIRAAQNEGKFISIRTPIKLDMSMFKLQERKLKSHYNAESQSRNLLSFYTAGVPYKTDKFTFNFFWYDDEHFKNYMIIKSPINNSINFMPLLPMDVPTMIGLVGTSITIENTRFDYMPVKYEVQVLI